MAGVDTSTFGDSSFGGGSSSSTFGNFGGGVSDIFSFLSTQDKEQGLQFEEQNYEAAARLALENEQFTKTSTAIKQQQSDRELFTSIGKTEAALGGANLAASGSGLDILRESAQEGATTRAVVGQQGLITEAGYQEQHDAYMNMAAAAKSAESATGLAGIGSLFGGGLKLFGAIAPLAL